MGAESGAKTVRESEEESEREVIEVTSEQVDTEDEPGEHAPSEESEAAVTALPEAEQPGAAPAQTAEPGGEPAADQAAVEAPGNTVYCVRCGKDMLPEDRFCRNCGWDSTFHNATPPPPARPRAPLPPNTSERNRLTALLLCILLGPFGAHRFYLGKVGTGVLYLVTFGILGIGVVFDVVMIATGECRDIEGKPVLRWD